MSPIKPAKSADGFAISQPLVEAMSKHPNLKAGLESARQAAESVKEDDATPPTVTSGEPASVPTGAVKRKPSLEAKSSPAKKKPDTTSKEQPKKAPSFLPKPQKTDEKKSTISEEASSHAQGTSLDKFELELYSYEPQEDEPKEHKSSCPDTTLVGKTKSKIGIFMPPSFRDVDLGFIAAALSEWADNEAIEIRCTVDGSRLVFSRNCECPVTPTAIPSKVNPPFPLDKKRKDPKVPQTADIDRVIDIAKVGVQVKKKFKKNEYLDLRLMESEEDEFRSLLSDLDIEDVKKPKPTSIAKWLTQLRGNMPQLAPSIDFSVGQFTGGDDDENYREEW